MLLMEKLIDKWKWYIPLIIGLIVFLSACNDSNNHTGGLNYFLVRYNIVLGITNIILSFEVLKIDLKN